MARNLTYGEKAFNCFFRFFMLTFLEFFICVLINLKAVSNILFYSITNIFCAIKETN